MKIIHVYILRRFAATLLFAVVSFVLVTIFVDMIGNLAKFIDRDVAKTVILKYYLVSLPYILIWVMPIAILLACLFSIGQMARHNEITAIKASGLPTTRILQPIFIAGLLISLVAFVFGEQIVPRSNRQRTKIQEQYLTSGRKRTPTRMNNIFLRDGADRRIFIYAYDTKRAMATKVSIQTYRGNKIVRRVDARQMSWQDSTWVLRNGYSRQFEEDREQAERFRVKENIQLDIKPSQIVQSHLKPEDMSDRELYEFIREVIHNGSDPTPWLVDYYSKFSLPMASFIMVLFGAPLAAYKNRSGAIVGFIISIVVWLVYYGLTKFFQTLGQVGSVPAMVAAWAANAIFFLAGLMVLFLTRK